MNRSRALAILSSAIIAAGFSQVAFAANSALAGQSAADSVRADGHSAPGAQTIDRVNKSRPRIGVALGGGGARGAAHVGVLRVLAEEGVPIDFIAGTSIGSVVGGLYSADVPLAKISKEFEDGKLMREFTPVPPVIRIILAPVIFIPRLFGYEPYDGLYTGLKFRKYADGLVEKSARNIENLRKPFAAVVTNVVDGQSERITQGDIGIAMQASTAVPGLRKPVQVNDRLYCDGGLVCNVPVSHVREMGADFVIAVDIDERLNQVPLKNFRVPGSVSRQALRIQLATSDHLLCKDADVVIHPNTDGITLISRKAKDGRRGLESGIEAARAAMPEIRGKLSALGVQLANSRTSSMK